MAYVNKTLDLPDRFLPDFAAGRTYLDGGDLRMNDGSARFVAHLKDAPGSETALVADVLNSDPGTASEFASEVLNSKYTQGSGLVPALAVAAVLAFGGLVYFLSRSELKATQVLNRRKADALAKELEATDETLAAVLSRRTLTRDDLRELHDCIGEFLRLADSPEYRDVELAADEGIGCRMFEFAELVHSFTLELNSEDPPQEPVPALPSAIPHSYTALMETTWRQLDYQQRYWPDGVGSHVEQGRN